MKSKATIEIDKPLIQKGKAGSPFKSYPRSKPRFDSESVRGEMKKAKKKIHKVLSTISRVKLP